MVLLVLHVLEIIIIHLTYPRATDPAYGAVLPIKAVDASGTVTVNVGVSAGIKIAGSSTAAINGTWAISIVYDYRTFVLDLGETTLATGTTGTDGTFQDIRKPFRTPNSRPVQVTNKVMLLI
ncbi:MAG: hypothetical protein CM15mV22_1790 [Eurybiavirus sp.]|nr:MAG: hypothetical protein CM15mV22_1790 [Eurybiavirus sp.]